MVGCWYGLMDGVVGLSERLENGIGEQAAMAATNTRVRSQKTIVAKNACTEEFTIIYYSMRVFASISTRHD